jgi:hypothetical protein
MYAILSLPLKMYEAFLWLTFVNATFSAVNFVFCMLQMANSLLIIEVTWLALF